MTGVKNTRRRYRRLGSSRQGGGDGCMSGTDDGWRGGEKRVVSFGGREEEVRSGGWGLKEKTGWGGGRKGEDELAVTFATLAVVVMSSS